MATYATKMQGGSITAEAVIAALTMGDAIGMTADEIAVNVGLPANGAALQHDLEEMLWQGLLDRRGVGRGALYTLSATAATAKHPTARAGLPGLSPKGSLGQKAG